MPTMRIRRGIAALCCAGLVLGCGHAAAQDDPATALRGEWHFVLESLPAHPMAEAALDAFLAVAPGETRDDKLLAVARTYADEPLGLYALETRQAEGGGTDALEDLMRALPKSRVAARAFYMLLDTVPDPIALCREVVAHGASAPARAARVVLADAAWRDGDGRGAFRLLLPAFAEILPVDTLAAGKLYPRLRAYAEQANGWLLRPEVDCVLRAADVPAERRAIAVLLPLLEAPDEELEATLDFLRARQLLSGAAQALEEADYAAFLDYVRDCLDAAAEVPSETITPQAIALSLQQLAHEHRDGLTGDGRAACETAARDAAEVLVRLSAGAGDDRDLQRDLLTRAVAAFNQQGRWEPERDAIERLLPYLRTPAERVPRLTRLATVNYFYWRDFKRVVLAERQLVLDFPKEGQRESTRYGMAVAEYLGEDYAAARAAIGNARGEATERTRDKLTTLSALIDLRMGDYEKAAATLDAQIAADPQPENLRQVLTTRAYVEYLLHGEAQAVPAYVRAIEQDREHRSVRTLEHLLRGIEAAPLTPRIADAAPEDGAPNVLLVSLDTVRADALGCYGDSEAHTPNIDMLAERGVVFEQAYSTSSWTKPAHASVFTGRFARTHGAMRHDERLSPAWPSLPELLYERGYETMGVVSAPPLNRLFGFARGFQQYDDATYLLDRQADVFIRRWGNPSVDIHTGHTGSLITDRAIAMLERRSHDDRPFFLFLNYFDAHHNYQPPYQGDRPFYGGTQYGEIDQWNNAPAPLDAPADEVDVPRLRALYRDELRYVDEQVGRLIAHLQRRGEFENTVVVVFGDHGDEFLEHGRLAHGYTLFNEVLHVPLMISGPGIAADQRSHSAVSLADVLPTLLDELGLEVPAELDGVDLLRDGQAAVPEDRPIPAWLDLPPYQFEALIASDHKLVVDTATNARQLFDLGTDPGEHHDVSAEKPGRAAAMQLEFDALRARSIDTFRRTTQDASVAVPAGSDSLDELIGQLRALGYVH
ncbi:MAG: sulfatase-like hydrolase/transferase [Candidatus Hydrogenedens sp.]|nr:sulfatase-like hydrolase/transferase [Candidatus Hydrogenedens sp.]